MTAGSGSRAGRGLRRFCPNQGIEVAKWIEEMSKRWPTG
jgi:hypothetical protein